MIHVSFRTDNPIREVIRMMPCVPDKNELVWVYFPEAADGPRKVESREWDIGSEPATVTVYLSDPLTEEQAVDAL